MDPQIPVAPPGTTDAITPAMYGAIGWLAAMLITWLGKNGLPYLKEAFGMVSARDKELAAAAKEGPIMVLEEVKRQLAASEDRAAKNKEEHTRQLAEVLTELKEMRKQHHDCETKHAALQTEVQFLRKEISEIKGQVQDGPG